MAGTIKRLAGPVALSNVYTTNVFNDVSALLLSVVRHIHVVNKTGAPVTFRLYLGATGGNAAGTELFFDHSVPANSTFDYYCALKMESIDFLVGGASAATSLTMTIEGEQLAA